ncbi:protein kinase domain-containing protein [Edaphobacter flagellatus]|uniref:protein kinase domain-containing protein n=1 Tax=Edaphobacter flagellatus TaxID=1933044 RepID=UPI0021B1F31E|nr:SPOR domain-containing protein [Edaphobacter flagellatus]
MKLWSDYEGRTIAEVYPLKKLLRPEGRSAFFVTTNGTGTASLVRVIEAHFDESEILDRWRTISEIKQENLITMRKFGETVLDGTPLVYAVMEPTEISLAELLENRTLTTDEAKQLAASLLSALKALHERGFVHGQVEPANILAAGETVKLRSDCVKLAVDDPDGIGPNIAEQKAADVHAVSVVLLQALTGRTSLQGSATLLPSPFDGIIRNGLSGRWGLTEMTAALGPVSPIQVAEAVAQPAKPSAAPQTPVRPVEPAAKAEPVASTEANAPASTAVQENLFEKQTAVPGSSTPVAKPPATAPAPATATSPKAVAESLPAEKPAITQTPDVRHRIVKSVDEADQKRNRMIVAGIAALVLLALLIGWRMVRSEPGTSTNTPAIKPAATSSTPDATATAPAATKPSATKPLSAKTSANNRVAAVPASPIAAAVNNQAAGGKTQWRVVAFTYNHEDQAQHKAETLAKQHPSLNAEVFSPTGHAPYLVTVGGPMTREQAEAFKQQARNQGLPRDIYAQNYSH